MTVVSITTEALDAMQAQFDNLKQKYILLATLYAWTNRQRVEAGEEVNRLLSLAQESWGPLWEENEHLLKVLSEQQSGCSMIDVAAKEAYTTNTIK